MTYDWFNVFNKTEFEALDLVSKTYEVIFEGVGKKEILVTKGNYLSVLIDEIFLSVNLNDKNPFEFEDYAVYLDEDNDVWIGIAVDED